MVNKKRTKFCHIDQVRSTKNEQQVDVTYVTDVDRDVTKKLRVEKY
jgi:hypothetical protein